MTYPPHPNGQNFGPGGPSQGGPPPGWGPQQGNRPQQGPPPGGPGPRQYGPQPGGWGGPQQPPQNPGQFGPSGPYQAPPGGFQQQGYPPQGYGPGASQYQYGPPRGNGKSKLPWIIGGAIAAIILILVLVLTLGGGKYAGDTTPQLPDSFGDWSRSSGGMGIGIGDSYTNGSDEVSVTRMNFDPEDESQMPEDYDPDGEDAPDEEWSVGRGTECVASSVAGMGTFAACTILYEDGGVVIMGESRDAVSDATEAFLAHT